MTKRIFKWSRSSIGYIERVFNLTEKYPEIKNNDLLKILLLPIGVVFVDTKTGAKATHMKTRSINVLYNANLETILQVCLKEDRYFLKCRNSGLKVTKFIRQCVLEFILDMKITPEDLATAMEQLTKK